MNQLTCQDLHKVPSEAHHNRGIMEERCQRKLPHDVNNQAAFSKANVAKLGGKDLWCGGLVLFLSSKDPYVTERLLCRQNKPIQIKR